MKKNKIWIGLLWLKVKFLGVCTKVCRLLKKTVIYESKTGYKELNPKYPTEEIEKLEELCLEAHDLYLGIDFLKDEYSLIDCPISESPHYRLMKVLRDGEDWKSTEYVSRMLKGALDERYEILAFYLNEFYFPNCYHKRAAEIEANEASLVSVYQTNGRYYLHDGKHRAALCALMGMKVFCKVLPCEAVLRDFNHKKVEKVLKSRKYTKHRMLFSAMAKKD